MEGFQKIPETFDAFLAVEMNDLVNGGRGLDERREAVAGDPGDAAVRQLLCDGLKDLQSVDDVTER